MNKQNVNGVLHFELESIKDSSLKNLKLLQEYAKKLNFIKISEIEQYEDKKISTTNVEARLQSRILVIDKNDLISIPPKSFSYFTVTLRNSQIIYFGMSDFSKNNKYTEKYQNFLEQHRIWHGQGNTLKHDITSNIADIIISHLSLLSLLRYGETIGIVSKIIDPTNYYNDKDAKRLARYCLKHIGSNSLQRFESIIPIIKSKNMRITPRIGLSCVI